jgi:hypothetical protein
MNDLILSCCALEMVSKPNWENIEFNGNHAYPISDQSIGRDLVLCLTSDPPRLMDAYKLEEFWMMCINKNDLIRLIPIIVAGCQSIIQDRHSDHSYVEEFMLLLSRSLDGRIDYKAEMIIGSSLSLDESKELFKCYKFFVDYLVSESLMLETWNRIIPTTPD